MDAIFRMDREKQNFLFYKEYQNDKAILGFHSHIELYFVDEGEMDMSVDGIQMRLGADQMCVVLSFVAHSYKTPTHSRSRVLIIPTYLCPDFLAVMKDKWLSSPFILDGERVREIKHYLKELNSSADNKIKKLGFLSVILGLVLDGAVLIDRAGGVDASLSSRILLYVNENFREDISLGSLATHLGYNKSYLSRYFKSSFHIGFNQYLTTIRLKNALMLMHEHSDKQAFCAHESGFNSLRTFYRAFRCEFGCSPKEYIKMKNE